MVKPISHGRHLFAKSGIPNIKLIKGENNEWIIFDGHHTLMTYLFLKRTKLSQIPHLVINGENGFFQDECINVFFGDHSKKLKNQNWRDYVINWNVPLNKQLSIRKRNSIGELFEAVRDKIELDC